MKGAVTSWCTDAGRREAQVRELGAQTRGVFAEPLTVNEAIWQLVDWRHWAAPGSVLEAIMIADGAYLVLYDVDGLVVEQIGDLHRASAWPSKMS